MLETLQGSEGTIWEAKVSLGGNNSIKHVFEEVLSHLPESEIWPMIQSQLEVASSLKTRRFPYSLTNLALLFDFPGIGDDEREWVGGLILDSRKDGLYKKTLNHIVEFVRHGDVRTEAMYRLHVGEKKNYEIDSEYRRTKRSRLTGPWSSN